MVSRDKTSLPGRSNDFSRYVPCCHKRKKKNENFSCDLMTFLQILGTKIDLRDDRETLSALAEQGLAPLKREQGQKLANKVRAVKYMECSALTQRGLKQVNK